MSSPCVQSFPDPLAHDSQTDAMRFVNPNSLGHSAVPSTTTTQSPTSSPSNTNPAVFDYAAPFMKSVKSDQASQTPSQQAARKFSYADLLSGQGVSSFDQESCYAPMSSPPTANDDYQHGQGTQSDTSTLSAETVSFMDPSSSVSLGSSFVGETSVHPTAVASHGPEVTSEESRQTLPPSTIVSSGMFTSMYPYMTCSPAPTMIDPHYLQQHRHSITGPPIHLGSSLYDPSQQRHHSFSHAGGQFLDMSHPRGTTSPPMTMMQNVSLLYPHRPLTPVSPSMSLAPSTIGPLSKDENQGMITDLCYSIPTPSSVHPMHRMNDAHFQRRPHMSTLPSNKPTDAKSKTTRSRGRRVSNIPSNGTRTFTCREDGCGKVFKRSEHLKRHIRSIHTLEKPYACPYQSCNKRFSRSDNLNQHIRIHRHSNHNGKQDKNVANNVHESHPFANFVQSYI